MNKNATRKTTTTTKTALKIPITHTHIRKNFDENSSFLGFFFAQTATRPISHT